MGIVLLLAIVLFILPLLLGAFFFRRNKKVGWFCFSIPFIVTIVMAGWWVYEANYHFVSSTPLEEEQIGDLSLADIVDEDMKETYGAHSTIDNTRFDESLQFNQLMIGTNSKQELIYIQTDDRELPTKKGIKVTDELRDVIELYGSKYYEYKKMGLGNAIIYLDREEKIQLQFWYQDDKVSQIVLKKL